MAEDAEGPHRLAPLLLSGLLIMVLDGAFRLSRGDPLGLALIVGAAIGFSALFGRPTPTPEEAGDV